MAANLNTVPPAREKSTRLELQTAIDSRMLVFRTDPARLSPTIRAPILHLSHCTTRKFRVHDRVQTSVRPNFGKLR